MAQRVQVLLLDDIDGTEATTTIPFAFDGINYTIDLSDKNAEKFRKAMETFVGSATRVGRATKKRPVTGGPSAREIREWGRQNGFDVPDRGAIPTAVREAFEAAS